MEINSYTAYKSSELEFFAEIPSHWSVWKVTHAFRSIGSGTTPKSDNTTFYDGDIPWITTSELREHVINESKQMVTEQAIREYPTLKMYDPGTLIIAMYGATIGRLGILGVPGTVNQACCVFDESEQLDTKFFFYWLCMYRPTLISLSVGGGQPNLSQDDLKQLRVPAPSISEQTQIARFLDHKTAQIDRLIEKKKALIEKLNEKRTALITQAVTKGLNPDAPMKDSGVDWLGEVPEHWEVRKLKFLCEFSTGWTPPTKQPEYFDGDNIWVTIADMDKKLIHDSKTKISDEAVSDFGFIQVPKGALLYSFKLSVGKVGFAGTNLYTNEAILFVLPNANYDINFLYYLFSVSIIKNASENIYGAKILNQELIKNSFLVYLSHKEQSQIAEFLDNKTTKIDKLANKASEAIDILNEYRTALITAAVTGKIDVRNVELPKSS